MTSVERRAEDFVIDAALLANAFGLSRYEVKTRVRAGTITSRCEAGVDEDVGRGRLSFDHGGRACRFIVDTGGNILMRATFPVRTVTQNPGAPGAYVEPGAGS